MSTLGRRQIEDYVLRSVVLMLCDGRARAGWSVVVAEQSGELAVLEVPDGDEVVGKVLSEYKPGSLLVHG